MKNIIIIFFQILVFSCFSQIKKTTLLEEDFSFRKEHIFLDTSGYTALSDNWGSLSSDEIRITYKLAIYPYEYLSTQARYLRSSYNSTRDAKMYTFKENQKQTLLQLSISLSRYQYCGNDARNNIGVFCIYFLPEAIGTKLRTKTKLHLRSYDFIKSIKKYKCFYFESTGDSVVMKNVVFSFYPTESYRYILFMPDATVFKSMTNTMYDVSTVFDDIKLDAIDNSSILYNRKDSVLTDSIQFVYQRADLQKSSYLFLQSIKRKMLANSKLKLSLILYLPKDDYKEQRLLYQNKIIEIFKAYNFQDERFSVSVQPSNLNESFILTKVQYFDNQ